MEWIPIALALIASIPGLLVLRKEIKYGRPDVLARYEELVTDLRAKNDALISRLDKLELDLKAQSNELEELRSGVVLLIAQLKVNGIEPVWQPRDRKTRQE